MRLAHAWECTQEAGVPKSLVRFIRPAIGAVPSQMARRLGHCRIKFVPQFDDPERTSQWSDTEHGVDVHVATSDAEQHDIALELLVCVGQALWDRLFQIERESFWRLLDAEIREGVDGEIDEEAVSAKRIMMANTAAPNRLRYLEEYGRASFAATAAEYVHSMWHDVHIRTGPEHLPARNLGRRLNLLARWFPPNAGYKLFGS